MTGRPTRLGVLAAGLAVVLLAGTLPISEARASDHAQMAKIAAAYRSDDNTTSPWFREELERLRAHPLTDIRAAASFVSARLLAREGDGEGARRALEDASAVRNLYERSWRWAEVDVLLAEGRPQDALSALAAIRERWPRFRAAEGALRLSRLREALGDPRCADEALELAKRAPIQQPQDELIARAARCLKVSDPARAAGLWRRLLRQHPQSDLRDEGLAALEAHGGFPETTAQQLKRTRKLFEARAYERCRASAEELWRRSEDQGLREELAYYLGKIGSERLRDDYLAAERYLRIAKRRGAPYAQRALSSWGIVLGKLGRVEEGLAAFDEWLRRYAYRAKRARVVEAHYDRGVALHRAGRSKEAAAGMARYLKHHRGGFDWVKYWWFVGWWRLAAGDTSAALEAFEPLTTRGNTLEGPKARYWSARALERQGKVEEATKRLGELVKSAPLTYYGGLAEARLRRSKGAVPGATATVAGRRSFGASASMAGPFEGLPETEAVRALRLASELGEPDTARAVLRRLASTLQRDLGSRRLQALERGLADVIEDFADARASALEKWRGKLGPRPTEETLDRWRAVYPRAYRTHVEAASRRDGVPPALLYAHILQESRFRPSMISGAPAFGLLELLDRTARRLTKGTKEAYALPLLMRPAENIRWGARYLGALIRKFQGQLPFASASYNGGPMLLERHLSANKGRPFDELIEDLATHESRNYVRKVIEHALRYARLYESPEAEGALRERLFPGTWTADYLEQPDY